MHKLKAFRLHYICVYICVHTHTYQVKFIYYVVAQAGSDVSKHLADAGVEVKPYTGLLDDIKTLALAHTKMWVDPAKVLHLASSSSYALFFAP